MKLQSLIALSFALGITATAQKAPPQQPSPYQGLSVGQPKILDPLELQTRIRALNAKLRALNFIDQPSLAAAVGKIQGAESEARALQVNANLMLPYTIVKDVITESTEKETTTKTQEKTKTTDQDKPGAAAPSVSASAKDPASVQISARDLMREQIQLEITNLVTQLSFIRSIGDRFSASGQERQRMVLAIPLNVESKFNNAVADFEISLKFSSNPANILGSVQVIGLFPDSTSYNKQVYTQSSTGFSGSALIQPLGLGFGSATDRKTSYLVQDKDLIAYEIGTSDKNVINLKYEIRPVLTQQTVEPGRRVVLVDLSLPFSAGALVNVESTVKSYWSFYDRGRARTTGTIRDTVVSSQTNCDITLPSGQVLRNLQRPAINTVDLIDIGSDKILVDVNGGNFLDGSTVVVGSTVFVQPDGASSQNENHLAFVAPIDDVVAYGGKVIGPFGDATPLVDTRDDGFAALGVGTATLESEGVTPTGEINLKAIIKFSGPTDNFRGFSGTSAHPSINFKQGANTDKVKLYIRGKSHVYGTTLRPIDSSISTDNGVTMTLRFTVSRAEALTEAFTVFRPFKAGQSINLNRPTLTNVIGPSVESVSVLSAGENVELVAKGTQLTNAVKLRIGGTLLPSSSYASGSLVFFVPAEAIKGVTNLGFFDNNGLVGLVPFDGKKLAPPEKEPEPPTVPTMADQVYGGKLVIAVKLPKIAETKFVSATLDGLDLVLSKAVLAGSKDLKDVIHIDLTKIKNPAQFDIQFKTDKGQIYIGVLKVVAPPKPAKPKEKE